MALFIGIDNGKKGGIAIIDENQQVVLLMPIPLISAGGKDQYDISTLNKVFNDLPDPMVFACLEKAYTLPLNGCKQNFVTGYQFGIIEAILTSNKVSYEVVSAQTWQKDIFMGQTVEDTKQASILFCKKKWPDIELKVGTKDSDGLSDALCMAVYCFRKNRGGSN